MSGRKQRVSAAIAVIAAAVAIFAILATLVIGGRLF